MYRVLKQTAVKDYPIPPQCPHQEWRASFHYELTRCSEFAGLEGRVVIDWGQGALAWHQHLKNKPVIEIFPKGRTLDPFRDYLDFTLSHSQLIDLMQNASAHRDWVSSLSAVAGVYLILAEPTGHQYVGSAYGLEGIWGRWQAYAANGHGGNAKLTALMKENKAYPKAFRFSLLQVLPKSTAKSEVIRWESFYKSKLGSRATGLNLN